MKGFFQSLSGLVLVFFVWVTCPRWIPYPMRELLSGAVVALALWIRWLIGNAMIDARVRKLGYDPSVLDHLDDE